MRVDRNCAIPCPFFQNNQKEGIPGYPCSSLWDLERCLSKWVRKHNNRLKLKSASAIYLHYHLKVDRITEIIEIMIRRIGTHLNL
jgi:adenylosuccinate synthase